MLLSLPVEVVERVVRLALPVEITSTTYGERHATLKTCCLVSSGMRTVAQPILEEALWIRERRTTRWHEAEKILSRLAKRLRFLWVAEHWEEKADDFAAILRSCNRLRELRLCGWRAFSLQTLKDLPVLRRLGLCDLRLDGSTCALHHVEELSLWCLSTAGQDSQAILTPATFPSVRHLTFSGDVAGSPFPVPSLVSSLTSIAISEFDIAHDPTAYEHPSTPRLLLRGPDWPENPSNDILGDLAEDLEDRTLQSSPQSAFASSTSLPPSLPASACDNLARFQRACAAHGIAVETEDHDDEYGSWDISPKFAAHAEDKKREREEGQAAAGTAEAQ
ncbi:hypothetical protein JCM10213v2_003188 [Rhodosporidiobolus nylandii]